MDKIQIKCLGRCIHFADANRIMWMESYGSGTLIYFTDNSKIWSTKILKNYSTLLHGNGFYRIHHKYLVNIDFVATCTFGNDTAATMTSQNKKCKWNNTKLAISSRRTTDFKNFICLKTSNSFIYKRSTLISKKATLIKEIGALVEK